MKLGEISFLLCVCVTTCACARNVQLGIILFGAAAAGCGIMGNVSGFQAYANNGSNVNNAVLLCILLVHIG